MRFITVGDITVVVEVFIFFNFLFKYLLFQMEGLGFSGMMETVNEVYKIPVLISKRMFQLFSSHMEILAAVGGCFIVWNVSSFLQFWYSMIQQYAIPCFLSRSKHIRQYGEWAIVTGE